MLHAHKHTEPSGHGRRYIYVSPR